MSYNLTRQTIRTFSTSLKACNKIASHAEKIASKDAPYGSFKTFAEYREFIIKKDPENIEARFKIMLSDGKPEACPEAEAENHIFGESAKKVAYNI